MLITGNTIIGDLLDSNPGLESILLERGMNCLGCPASRGETIAEACEVHDADLTELLSELNQR